MYIYVTRLAFHERWYKMLASMRCLVEVQWI